MQEKKFKVIYEDVEYQLTAKEKEIFENLHLYDIDEMYKLPMFKNAKLIEGKNFDNLTISEAYEMGLNISTEDKIIYYFRKIMKYSIILLILTGSFYLSYNFVSNQNIKLDTLFNKGK